MYTLNSKTILFYQASSFFFLFIDLYFLFPAAIKQIFTPIAKLVIPIEISTKEAKAEMKTHPVIVEIKIRSVQYTPKLYKLFYASYSVIHFDLFLQVNSFLFYLFFSI